MLNFIKRCIKESQELDNVVKGVQNACQYESSTSDCNLVQQLKEKQAAKKVIDDEIKAYEQYDLSIVYYVKKFFKILEQCGFQMDKTHHYSGRYNTDGYVDFMFSNYFGISILDKALYYMSEYDIDNFSNELKAFKQRSMIIEERKTISNTLAKDIADIKTKLGIE